MMVKGPIGLFQQRNHISVETATRERFTWFLYYNVLFDFLKIASNFQSLRDMSVV